MELNWGGGGGINLAILIADSSLNPRSPSVDCPAPGYCGLDDSDDG